MIIVLVIAVAFAAGLVAIGVLAANRLRNLFVDAARPVAAGTRLDQLAVRIGTVVIKSYGDNEGSISNYQGSTDLQPVELRDSTSGDRALGVIIHIQPHDPSATSQSVSINDDELANLIAAIDSMSRTSHAGTSFGRFEAHYITRGLFRVTVFDDYKGNNQASLSAGTIVAASHFLTMEELSKLRNALSNAKGKLDAIR